MLRFLAIECLLLAVGCGYPALPSLDDAAVGCKISSRCTDVSSPVCDPILNGGSCVQCTAAEHQACTNNTPLCVSDKCVACFGDTDCGAGGLCLPSGACASLNNIIHVTSGGSSADGCGDAATPCTLDKALLVVMVTPGKTVIKIDDNGTYVPQGSNNFIVDADVTIDMRAGATLHSKVDGPVLEIKNNRTVAILGGTIEMATGSNGDGILCNDKVKFTVVGTTIRMTDKSAINMLSGCSLTVTQVKITNTSFRQNTFVAGILDNGDSITISRSSLIANRGGGIAISSGIFIIVGNAFLNNGTDGSGSTGGIAISTTPNSTNRIDFNTISTNTILIGGKGGAIDCNAGTDLVGRYNIFWNNKAVQLGTSLSQISGGCKYAYSAIGPGGAAALLPVYDGGNNSSMDPMLVNEMTDPHLITAASPAIGYAAPNADLTGLAALDIDGDMRVKRTTGNQGADIGADQYKP